MSIDKKDANIKQNFDSNNRLPESGAVGETLTSRSKYTLDLINGWIANADTKVNISNGVFSVVVAIMVFVGEQILANIDKTAGPNCIMHGIFVISMLITVVLFLTSEFFHLRAISPSLKASAEAKGERKKAGFSIFYDEIKEFSNPQEYIAAAKNITSEQFAAEILKEVYYNSTICSNKMRRFKKGIWTAWGTILMLLVSGFLYYLSYTVH